MDQAAAPSGPASAGLRRGRALPAWIAVPLGAIILLLPALWNGRPFVFWDTASYLAVGKLILAADPTAAIVPLENNPALLANPPTLAESQALLATAASHLGARAVTYSLFLERGLKFLSFWGVAFLQCLSVAAALYLAFAWLWRSAARGWVFVLTCAVVAAFTSGGVVATLLLPDIFAAPLLLLIALLFVAWPSLSRGAILGISGGLVFCLLLHTSHAPIAFAMTIVGALLVRLRSASLRAAWPPAAMVLTALVAAIVLRAGLKDYADHAVGTPLERPPFLVGRVIDDGPGRLYLENRCEPARFEICRYRDRVLSQTSYAGDSFLFRREVDGGGVYMAEPIAVRERLRAQELPFVADVVLAYPLAQLWGSLKNAATLLLFAKLDQSGSKLSYHYESYAGAGALGWPGTNAMLDSLPGIDACKQHPHANCGRLDFRIFERIAYAGGLLGAAVLAWVAAGFVARHRLSFTKLDMVEAFVLMIVVGVAVNAVVCGALAGPFDRYQTRVAWLLPALAFALVILSPDKILTPRRLLERLRAASASA